MVNVVFVAPYAREATNRFIRAFVALDDARVAVVSTDPLENFPDDCVAKLAGHWRIDNCLDTDQLAHAVGSVGAQIGGVDALTGILETLQVPLAEVRERLGLAGLGVHAANNFRDKAQMKAAFKAAGVPCARNVRVSSADDARRAFNNWKTPVVVKPLAGMGAQNTFRLDDEIQLEQWLAADPPTAQTPVLLEEFLTGLEFTFESVVIDGQLVWHSICRYDPTPLTVVQNSWIQWAVVLPRNIDGDEFAPIRSIGPQAVGALGMTTGLSHLEWFLRPNGSIAVSEIGARPPGAQIATLMSWAHDRDMYSAWARLITHGVFDPPERKYAVGAAFLRAQGAGRTITDVSGIDDVSASTRDLVVETQLPQHGATRASSYEGDGFVIVRAEDTAAVDAALAEIISVIRVECA